MIRLSLAEIASIVGGTLHVPEDLLAGSSADERVSLLRKPFGQSELLDQVARLLGEPA